MIEPTGPEDLFKWFPRGEINELERLLAIPLTNEIGQLQMHLAELAVQQGVVSRLLADADSLLAFSEQQQLLKRDPDMTDLDRRRLMTASTRNERRIRDILKGFSGALRGKLIAVMGMKKTLMGDLGEIQNPEEP